MKIFFGSAGSLFQSALSIKSNENENDNLLGAYLLPKILREQGFNVETELNIKNYITGTKREEIISKISSHEIICLTSTTFEWPFIKDIISEIKTISPDAKIILGGIHATLVPQYIMESTEVDVLVVGEGDKAIVEICRSFEENTSLEYVSGILYRKENSIVQTAVRTLLTNKELGELPILNVADFEKSEYLKVQTSRGCLFSCSFCNIPFRKSWRNFPSEHIIKSIEANYSLLQASNVKTVIFADDCFTADKKFAIDLLYEIKEKFPELQLQLEARINDLCDEELLQAIADTNILGIQVGVECGYDSGLKRLKKGTSVKKLYELAELAKRYKVGSKLRYSYIIGFPWESYEEIKQTIDTAYKIIKISGGIIQINWLIVTPGTVLFEELKKDYGFHEALFDKVGAVSYSNETFYKTHPWLNPEMVSYYYEYNNLLKSFYTNSVIGSIAYMPPTIAKHSNKPEVDEAILASGK